MGNRADRRASAKIARQAMKRAKSPTDSAILKAAMAFLADEPPGQIGSVLSSADFDDAWARLTPDLQDVLLDEYPHLVTQTYAEAGLGVLRTISAGELGAGMGTRLFLCPVSGAPGKLSAFADDQKEIARLAASLRESGVVPENGRCLVLPVLLPMAAFAPEATPPGRVRGLHDHLSGLLVETFSGKALPSSDSIRGAVAAFVPAILSASGTEFGALVGIELMATPPMSGKGSAEEELEADDIARTAAIDSWHDTYAADIAGIAIGSPLDWPACAAALAWETIRIPMEVALLGRGVPNGRPDVIHCAATDDSERLIVSAVSGSVAVGPFSAPSNLVWFDADEFFARVEASAETLAEHDDEAGVIGPLLGSA